MKRMLVLVLFLAWTGWAIAGDRNKGSRLPANGTVGVETKDAGAVLPSGVVERRVEKLKDQIHWSTSLDEAKAAAKAQKKPIFWIHLLGDLDGEC
jgi:hypothetical protein